jgi:hypothetical protein
VTTEITPRDRVHIKVCRDTRCITETATPGDQCQNLDFLLDQAENARLQALYKRLCDMHMDTLLLHGSQVAQGLALAIKEVHALLPDAGDSPFVSENTPEESS